MFYIHGNPKYRGQILGTNKPLEFLVITAGLRVEWRPLWRETIVHGVTRTHSPVVSTLSPTCEWSADKCYPSWRWACWLEGSVRGRRTRQTRPWSTQAVESSWTVHTVHHQYQHWHIDLLDDSTVILGLDLGLGVQGHGHDARSLSLVV